MTSNAHQLGKDGTHPPYRMKSFLGDAMADNPSGQGDELTPFYPDAAGEIKTKSSFPLLRRALCLRRMLAYSDREGTRRMARRA